MCIHHFYNMALELRTASHCSFKFIMMAGTGHWKRLGSNDSHKYTYTVAKKHRHRNKCYGLPNVQEVFNSLLGNLRSPQNYGERRVLANTG